MMNMFRLGIVSGFLLLMSAGQAFAAGERITDFRSDIIVRSDSVAEVTETIAVVATGEQIKHGIYRDFPTTYRDKLGNTVAVGFHVKKVQRDFHDISYTIEARSNGQRVYLGDAKFSIEPGRHTFVLSYEADRELGYFRDYDEIYWNVTGNGWNFPIDRAEATIELPQGAKILQDSAYTGYSGATGRDYTVTSRRDGKISFATTRGLNPTEGLTVAVGWPKGLVKEPSGLDKIIYLIRDNTSVGMSAAAFLLLLIYYLVIWRQMRASEPEETIIPLFAPPQDMPVPAVSFIYHKGVHSKTLPATIIDMAVKGFLDIIQEQGFLGSHFSLQRNPAHAAALPDIEKLTGMELFSEGDHLKLEKKNYQILQRAGGALKSGLKTGFEDDYFSDNYQFIYIGVGFTALAGFIVYALSHGAVLPLVIMGFTLALNAIFVYPIKYYTRAGADLVAAIEGFKMFLSVTEKERFDTLNTPDVTPEIFEKYFPYAVALGVEGKWSDKFSRQLEASGQSMQNYHPRWHQGYRSGGLRELSSDLGSGLASAISSSSSPPGSSSGSGGGGSSGGGGGGGGGGGF